MRASRRFDEYSHQPQCAPRRWFKRRNIDIHAFTIRLPRSFHSWLHSGGPRGGQWNDAWRQFREEHPDANQDAMNYFRMKEDRAAGYTGFVDAAHRWGLPGIYCPVCKSTWSGGAKVYPSVDLTPVIALADFEDARTEPIEEYERLSELVRPLLPPEAQLEPGAAFGPLVGKAQGRFGQFVSNYSFLILIRREAYEQLQSEPLRGLKGCRMEVRFRQRNPPELLELELIPNGRVHPDCLPPDRKPPCPRCPRRGIPLPKDLLLDATSLPTELDLFRLEDFPTVVVCTKRFVEACQRLGLDGLAFAPLPVR